MSATKQKGSEANTYGRLEGQRIARYLNATHTRSNSNECTINAIPIVIKCAHLRTGSVGVSIAMLKRLHSVMGAFETANGNYNLYRLCCINPGRQLPGHNAGGVKPPAGKANALPG